MALPDLLLLPRQSLVTIAHYLLLGLIASEYVPAMSALSEYLAALGLAQVAVSSAEMLGRLGARVALVLADPLAYSAAL